MLKNNKNQYTFFKKAQQADTLILANLPVYYRNNPQQLELDLIRTSNIKDVGDRIDASLKIGLGKNYYDELNHLVAQGDNEEFINKFLAKVDKLSAIKDINLQVAEAVDFGMQLKEGFVSYLNTNDFEYNNQFKG